MEAADCEEADSSPVPILEAGLAVSTTTVWLPGLPHPSIVQLLVEALGNTRKIYTMDLANIETESGEVEGGLACGDCSAAGWACYEGTECIRFSTDTAVSITKETYVGEHGLV